MATAILSSKGQVTIPREVRANLGVSEGDRLDFVRLESGGYAIYPKTGSILDLEGFIDPGGRRATLEDMDEAIAEGAVWGETGP